MLTEGITLKTLYIGKNLTALSCSPESTFSVKKRKKREKDFEGLPGRLAEALMLM